MKGFLVSCLAAAALAALSAAPATAQPRPPTAAEFARAPAISSVDLSPDGRHIVALTSPNGKDVVISVWKTANLQAKPTVLGSQRMRFTGVQFIKNNRLIVGAQQPYTQGPNRFYVGKTLITDLEGREWKEPLARGDTAKQDTVAALIDDLPQDPAHILVESRRNEDFGDIFKINLSNMTETRVQRGSSKYGNAQTDLKGEIRARQYQDYENGDAYIAQQLRHPDTGEWQEHFRWYAKNREPVSVVGFAKDPNIAYVSSNRGRDKSAIYEYDIRARKLLEPVFEHRLYDAVNVAVSRNPADYGALLGFVYQGPSASIYWVDPELEAREKTVGQALKLSEAPLDWTDIASGARVRTTMAGGPAAHIVDWSDDRRLALVNKSGPQHPDEWYLLRDGTQLTLLGKSRPWLDSAALGQTRLVQYPARDGLMIPAFLTTPPASLHGPGPYPAIVLPHGGPWGRDDYSFDSSGWTTYFAARGYAVLQPQFRGSSGWGQKLWRAGDAEWGQKMQDDNDDAAKWMIAQKIADPGRIAIHGFSYGGYAALAGAIRPNGLYQCAIAGAPGEIEEFKRSTYENRLLRAFQNPTARGLNIMANLQKASIPVMVYQGTHDDIVEPKIGRAYAQRLRGLGKSVKYVEVDEMMHGFAHPDHTVRVLNEVEGFLKTDCGPGGL